MLLECTRLRDVILMTLGIKKQVAMDMPELSPHLSLSICRTTLFCFWHK